MDKSGCYYINIITKHLYSQCILLSNNTLNYLIILITNPLSFTACNLLAYNTWTRNFFLYHKLANE